MKSVQKMSWLGWVALLALTAAALLAPASPQPAQAQDNLLKNGDFEQQYFTFAGISSIKSPQDWEPWWNDNTQGCENVRPNMNAANAPNRLRNGLNAASIWTQGPGYGYTWQAGLLQVVEGVSEGGRYRFSAYGHAWSTDKPDQSGGVSDPSAAVNMEVGIDPQGGKDPFASSIVWSGYRSILDSYQEVAVEAVAAGSRITVFLKSQPSFCTTQNDAYWDEARLFYQGQGEAAPPAAENNDDDQGDDSPPPAAQQPASGVPIGSIQRAAPDETGRVVHIVRSGETLIGIALTYEVTLDQIRANNNLSNDVIRVGQELVIETGGGGSGGGSTAVEEAAEEAEEPTPTPAPTPTPEPTPELPGSVCIIHYTDTNANSTREFDEGPMEGVTFAINNGEVTLQTYTTGDGSDTHCFEGLEPGNYIVSWIGDQYTPTTDQTWATTLESGAAMTHEFGARLTGAPLPGEEIEEGGGGSGLLAGSTLGLPTWAVVVAGAVGGVFLLSGIGALAYFLLMRRKARI